MADHGGQPQLAGWLTFDVTNLQVTVEPGVAPTYILQTDVPFTLTVTFTGDGTDWDNMNDDAQAYQVRFYAEGIGAAATDLDFAELPTDSCNMNGADTYTVDHSEAAGIAQEGIYRFGAIVTFPGKNGVLGFYEGLLVQVNPAAD
jgi:hypothetical protein